MICHSNSPFSANPQLVWRASVGGGTARLAADLRVRVLVSELSQLTESFAVLDLCSAVVGQLRQLGNRRAENGRDEREHHRLLEGHHGGRREKRKVKSDKPSESGLAKRANPRQTRSTTRLYTLTRRAAKPSTPHDGTMLLAAGIPSLDRIRIHRQHELVSVRPDRWCRAWAVATPAQRKLNAAAPLSGWVANCEPRGRDKLMRETPAWD